MARQREQSLLFDAPGPKALRKIRVANIIAACVFALFVIAVLMRLSNPPEGENQLSSVLWNPAIETEAWVDFYLPGLWMTLKASMLAVVGSIIFGLFFGLCRLLPNFIIRSISAVIVEFCRAVPVLMLMIFLWRAFALSGMKDASYWAVVLALIMYNGSVVAELVRAGVGNLPNGQREASLALGLSEYQSLTQIEMPQAIIAMMPAAVTQLVVVLKDTALGSIIMYTDLLQESRRLGSMYFNILQTLSVAAVIYFLICLALSWFAEWLPAHLKNRTAAPTEADPVAPIAIMDPSNVNQMAVAAEVKELPYGGTPRKYHVHHRGTNASIHHWRRTRYIQGYDEHHLKTGDETEKNLKNAQSNFGNKSKNKPKDNHKDIKKDNPKA